MSSLFWSELAEELGMAGMQGPDYPSRTVLTWPALYSLASCETTFKLQVPKNVSSLKSTYKENGASPSWGLSRL